MGDDEKAKLRVENRVHRCHVERRTSLKRAANVLGMSASGLVAKEGLKFVRLRGSLRLERKMNPRPLVSSLLHAIQVVDFPVVGWDGMRF